MNVQTQTTQGFTPYQAIARKHSSDSSLNAGQASAADLTPTQVAEHSNDWVIDKPARGDGVDRCIAKMTGNGFIMTK